MRLHLVICVGLVLLVLGCGGPPPAPPPLSAEGGLKELAEMYRYLDYSQLPPPKNVDQLFNEYAESLQTALPRIQSGEYEMVWGVGFSKVAPSSSGVLAFEKKAATEGGAVLLRDGTVKQMTAQEFAAARQRK